MKQPWEKRLNGYFIAFCRKTFRWSPAYRASLKAAFIRKDNDCTEWYRCKGCGNETKRVDKQVDHIEPVVRIGTSGAADWNVYRDRMGLTSADSSNLQVLCRTCHKAKSKTENAERRRIKKENKKCSPKLKKRRTV